MNKAFEKIIDELKQESIIVDDDAGHRAVEIIEQMAKEYNGGWIPCSERLPDNDKNEYIVQKTNGFIDVLEFTKDAYKLDRYDFAEYKDKNKQLFYDYDSEYGYSECECVAWQPLPEPFKERD